MSRQKLIYFLLVLLPITSCDGGSNSDDRSESDTSQVRGHEEILKNTAKVLTLPTPMQIPALLKNTNAVYDASNLLPIVTSQKSYYKSGLLFGMYMLDLGYTSSFSHQQASLNYFKACKQIGDDLGLGVKITQGHVNRFNENLNKPDSLGRIILDMYDLGHKVLIDQEKEGLGFLMVLGCYMEGLNIVLDQAQDHDLILFVHLLNQQKNYGNNLKSVLNGYEIPLEIQQEVKDFNTVLNTLNKIDLPSVYELKSGSKTIVGIKRGDITLIKQSVSSFRKSILI